MSVTCPSCAAEFRAGDQYAGRVAKCPGCQNPFRLPSLTPENVVDAAERCSYPYEHAKGRMSLAQFVMPHVPTQGDLASVFTRAARRWKRSPRFTFDCLGK